MSTLRIVWISFVSAWLVLATVTLLLQNKNKLKASAIAIGLMWVCFIGVYVSAQLILIR